MSTILRCGVWGFFFFWKKRREARKKLAYKLKNIYSACAFIINSNSSSFFRTFKNSIRDCIFSAILILEMLFFFSGPFVEGVLRDDLFFKLRISCMGAVFFVSRRHICTKKVQSLFFKDGGGVPRMRVPV